MPEGTGGYGATALELDGVGELLVAFDVDTTGTGQAGIDRSIEFSVPGVHLAEVDVQAQTIERDETELPDATQGNRLPIQPIVDVLGGLVPEGWR